jgi:hypothetical protein
LLRLVKEECHPRIGSCLGKSRPVTNRRFF